MKKILFVLFVGLLTACNSTNYIGIETYNPAEVTFPNQVEKLLIVNNAVAQPENSGYELLIQGKKQDTCRVEADSALFAACGSLGTAIADASFFDDVLLYHQGVRQDHNAFLDTQLSQEQVKSLCEETGAEAVVSIDRLLFDMKKEIVDLGVYVVGTIQVKMSGVVRSYVPERESPLATVIFNDSIFWEESANYTQILDQILPSPNEALCEAGQYFGLKIYSNFVPHWKNEMRWFFTGMGSRWKEASAYADKERWEEAESRWLLIYKGSKKWSSQARVASNLALCSEMKGDLPKALEWAQKSYDLFKENKGDKENLRFMETYVNVLTERIRLDKKLNIQFGKE